jgi:GDPmannose 4,6-dehydratase
VPRALITGLSGQDGSFLAELLLERGYSVAGAVRDPQRGALHCSEHLRNRVQLVRGELLEPDTLRAAVAQTRPDEIYHLAAPSFVPHSWECPEETLRAIAGATAALLEAVRDLQPSARLFLAASAAIFGEPEESPQNERTRPRPDSPYALAKLAAHELIGLLRAHAGLHASSAILFNHESERRSQQFVTRKITRAAAAISLGQGQELVLGGLDAVRDWSFAGDIMDAARLMLQQDDPDDYVLASGVPHTVGDFARAAFQCVGLELEEHLRIDPALDHSTTASVGDPRKARARLGWTSRVDFDGLVARMVQADLRELRQPAARS